MLFENRNRHEFLQRRKKKSTIFLSGSPVNDVVPPFINEALFWFPDYNLSSPGLNNFVWLDAIDNSRQFLGNYGTGTGIIQVNGFNVLNTFEGSVASIPNLIPSTCNGITIMGFLQMDLNIYGRCHSFYNINEGKSLNIYRQADGSVYVRYNISDRVTYTAPTVFVDNEVFCLRFRFEGLTAPASERNFKFWTKSNEETSNNNGVPNSNCNYYLQTNITGNTGHNVWRGNIGEFIGINRLLNDSECLQLSDYFVNKYGITGLS